MESYSKGQQFYQRSWGKVIFSEACVKTYVHRRGSTGPHPRGKLRGLAGGISRPTPKEEVEGSGRGGSPGTHPRGKLRGVAVGGLQAHTQGVSRPTPRGCIPACTEADPPPSRRLLLRSVRILLECILVGT